LAWPAGEQAIRDEIYRISGRDGQSSRLLLNKRNLIDDISVVY